MLSITKQIGFKTSDGTWYDTKTEALEKQVEDEKRKALEGIFRVEFTEERVQRMIEILLENDEEIITFLSLGKDGIEIIDETKEEE
jgi:hypothetical protein